MGFTEVARGRTICKSQDALQETNRARCKTWPSKWVTAVTDDYTSNMLKENKIRPGKYPNEALAE